jgi:hypothetical protein
MTNLIKEAEEWLNAEEHEQLLAETGAGKPYTETIEKELIEKLTEALKRQQEVLPCDVKINHITYKKGLPLKTVIDAATRWHNEASSAYAVLEGKELKKTLMNELANACYFTNIVDTFIKESQVDYLAETAIKVIKEKLDAN